MGNGQRITVEAQMIPDVRRSNLQRWEDRGRKELADLRFLVSVTTLDLVRSQLFPSRHTCSHAWPRPGVNEALADVEFSTAEELESEPPGLCTLGTRTVGGSNYLSLNQWPCGGSHEGMGPRGEGIKSTKGGHSTLYTCAVERKHRCKTL